MAESTRSRLNWAQRAVLWAGMKSAQFLGSQTYSLTDDSLFARLGVPTASGKAVTDQSAMQVSTVWACVRILAEAVGQLPLAVYEKDRGGNLNKVEHALGEVLIDAPNADMTSNEYREAFMTNMGLRGSSYSYIERGAKDRIVSLYPVPSRNVQVKRSLDGQIVDAVQYREGEIVYRINDRGRWETYPASKIWHKRTFSLDGVNGLSPIAYAREAMSFSMGLEEFGAKLFAQGLWPGSIVKYPTWLKDDQRKLAEERLARLYQGYMNSGKPFLLEGGMELQEGIIPPKDAEFLGLKGFGVEEICRFYLVPPHRVASLERATNNNIEQLSLEFVMYTLLPYLVKIERSADRWLFKPGERGRFVVRFNYDGLLRADSEGRAKLLSTLLQNGVLSRNEARDIEHRPRSDADGMDDYTVQSNMAMITLLEQLSRSQAAKSDEHLGALLKAFQAQSGSTDSRLEKLIAQLAVRAPAPAPSIVVHPPAVKVDGPRVDVHLPESMSHEVSHRVEVPGVAQLAGEVRSLAGRIASGQEKNAEALDRMTAAQNRPRKAIFDAEGNPIGTAPVDAL